MAKMFRWQKCLGGKNVQVAKMFARADKNGDGKLDKEEWHRVLNSAGCRTSMWDQQCANDEDELFYHVGEDDFQDNICGGNQIVSNPVVFRKPFAFLKFISAIAVVSIDAQRIKSDKNTWTDIVQNCFTRSLKSSTFDRPKMLHIVEGYEIPLSGTDSDMFQIHMLCHQGRGGGVFCQYGSRLWREVVFCRVHGRGDASRKGQLELMYWGSWHCGFRRKFEQETGEGN